MHTAWGYLRLVCAYMTMRTLQASLHLQVWSIGFLFSHSGICGSSYQQIAEIMQAALGPLCELMKWALGKSNFFFKIKSKHDRTIVHQSSLQMCLMRVCKLPWKYWITLPFYLLIKVISYTTLPKLSVLLAFIGPINILKRSSHY